jgi:hypothetical protein
VQRVSSRTLLVLLFALTGSGHDALAQSLTELPRPPAETVVDAESRAPRRPALLIPLYYSVATLQAADIVTTSMAVAGGAREVNPLVAAVGDENWKVSVTKAAGLAATIAVSEYLWKHGHRKLAVTSIVFAAALNTAVVLNNVAVVQGQRGR